MSLHYLNPDDEPRACPVEWHAGNPWKNGHRWHGGPRWWSEGHSPDCDCHGTGRLGNPEAPRVEVDSFRTFEENADPRLMWYWRNAYRASSDTGWSVLVRWSPPYATEALALEAARKALGGRS